MQGPSGGDMNNIPDSGQTQSCWIPGYVLPRFVGKTVCNSVKSMAGASNVICKNNQQRRQRRLDDNSKNIEEQQLTLPALEVNFQSFNDKTSMLPRSDEKEVPSGPRMLMPLESDSIFSWVGGLIEYEVEDSIASTEDLFKMTPPRIEGDWTEQLNLIPLAFFKLSFWVAMTKLFLSTRSSNFPERSRTTNWEAVAPTTDDPIKTFLLTRLDFLASSLSFSATSWVKEFKMISRGLEILRGLPCKCFRREITWL